MINCSDSEGIGTIFLQTSHIVGTFSSICSLYIPADASAIPVVIIYNFICINYVRVSIGPREENASFTRCSLYNYWSLKF